MANVNGDSADATVPTVKGTNVAVTPNGIGVEDVSENGWGVHGRSTSGRGVVARSETDYGVRAHNRASAGLRASSDEGRGVEGWSTKSEGVHAETKSKTTSAMAVYQQEETSETACEHHMERRATAGRVIRSVSPSRRKYQGPCQKN